VIYVGTSNPYWSENNKRHKNSGHRRKTPARTPNRGGLRRKSSRFYIVVPGELPLALAVQRGARMKHNVLRLATQWDDNTKNGETSWLPVGPLASIVIPLHCDRKEDVLA